MGINNLTITHPELIKEWDYEKNTIKPTQVSRGSDKKAWWVCEQGHSYESSISHRVGGRGCPICGRIRTAAAREQAIVGVNDIESQNELLFSEWNWGKNKKKPSEVRVGSNKKVWWKCKLGHEWEASPNTRKQGHNCPVCCNQKVLEGYNDLATLRPEIAKEWNYEKNKELLPTMVNVATHKKVWWVCSLGHDYQAAISDRTTRNNGCPYCSNPARKILIGFNDLQTTNPEKAAEWDYDKNIETPQEVTKGNNKTFYWRCSLGHSFRQAVNTRTGQGCGCPYCSEPPKKVLKGFNDFATKYPEMLSRWDYDKNSIMPDEILPGSHKKVWWICELGHSYYADIHDITQGNGCSICAKENRTSFPEQAVFYYVQREFPDAISGDKHVLNGKELDIYIPSKKIAIEYDGAHWHQDIQRDRDKVNLCHDLGIELINIRESRCPDADNSENTYIYEYGELSSLSNIIEKILTAIKPDGSHCIDVEKDREIIYSRYIKSIKDNSLAVKLPEVAKEWHPTRNGYITPLQVKAQSNKTFWWKCEKGHEWEAKVSVRNKNGCPVCANRRIVVGVNDFATTNSEMLGEWNYEKNIILPTQITYGYSKKVWWKCEKGHEWEATVHSRVSKGYRCPECVSKKRKIVNIDTNENYASMEECARKNGVSVTTIKRWCNKGDKFLFEETT